MIVKTPIKKTTTKKQSSSFSFSPSLASLYLFEQCLRLGVSHTFSVCLPLQDESLYAAVFLTPEYKQRIAHEPPVEREVMRWSSHSEAMLQAALDDVDWDMFRASSSDVSEFMDVALTFVNTLNE